MTPAGWRVWFADFSTMQSTTHDLAAVEAYAAAVPAVYVMKYFREEWAPGKPYREDCSGGDTIELDGVYLVGAQLPDAEFDAIKRDAYAAETL
jgi:hypothetical protein